MDTDFLDWALADFSGYVAADELYDGPFCILSAVDNRRYKRLLYDVLDHDPTHDDIRAFLRRLQTALTARALTLWASPPMARPSILYPSARCSAESRIKSVVSYRGRGEQSGLRSRGQRPQGPGGHATQTAQRPSEHAGREGGGPHEKAARSSKAPRCSPIGICLSNVT